MYFVNWLERILSCVSDVSDSEDIRGDDGSVAKPGDLKQQETDHWVQLLNWRLLIVSQLLTFNHKSVDEMGILDLSFQSK